MKTLTNIASAVCNRVGISFNMDNAQITVFLTKEEFLSFMVQVFEYRDAHKEELQEVIRNLYQ